MGCEESSHLSLPEPRHYEPYARHPLVEMRGDPGREIVIGFRLDAEVSQELGDHEAEYDNIIDLHITLGRPDAGGAEQLLLELVHLVCRGANIEQDHLRVPIHQPPPAHDLIAGTLRMVASNHIHFLHYPFRLCDSTA